MFFRSQTIFVTWSQLICCILGTLTFTKRSRSSFPRN